MVSVQICCMIHCSSWSSSCCLEQVIGCCYCTLSHAHEPSDAYLVGLLRNIKQNQGRPAQVNVFSRQFPFSVLSRSCLKDEDEKGVLGRVRVFDVCFLMLWGCLIFPVYFSPLTKLRSWCLMSQVISFPFKVDRRATPQKKTTYKEFGKLCFESQ